MRPDVFHALNLYNSNSRLQDNTIYLDWSTTEKEYLGSKLYELSGRYFSMQNSKEVTPKEAWDHYYQETQTSNAIFKRLLKTTFQKPRDILTFIKISRELKIKLGQGKSNHFTADLAVSPTFTRKFADYLLGETKNYAAFYMPQTDFQHFLKFFQCLDGKSKFNYKEFSMAFKDFAEWSKGETIKSRHFLRDPESLLQFFYDVNIIGYSEETKDQGETYYHWSYRERSLNDVSPKIKSTGTLVINPGIAKALDIGKNFKRQSESIPRKTVAVRHKHSRRHKKQHAAT